MNDADSIEEQDEEQLAPDRQQINLEPIFDGVEAVMAENGVKEFVFIFVKEGLDRPLMFWKNPNGDHKYDATALIAATMRDLKAKIIQDLDC